MVNVLSRDEVPASNRRPLHAVAVVSLISFFCIICAIWNWMPAWKGFERFPGLVCILPFWLPYGFVFLRVLQGRIKSGLFLAGVMGCALLVPGIFLLRFVFEWERSWWIRGKFRAAGTRESRSPREAVFSFQLLLCGLVRVGGYSGWPDRARFFVRLTEQSC